MRATLMAIKHPMGLPPDKSKAMKNLNAPLLLTLALFFSGFSFAMGGDHKEKKNQGPTLPAKEMGRFTAESFVERELQIETWMKDIHYLSGGVADLSDPVPALDGQKRPLFLFGKGKKNTSTTPLSDYLIPEKERPLPIEEWMTRPLSEFLP